MAKSGEPIYFERGDAEMAAYTRMVLPVYDPQGDFVGMGWTANVYFEGDKRKRHISHEFVVALHRRGRGPREYLILRPNSFKKEGWLEKKLKGRKYTLIPLDEVEFAGIEDIPPEGEEIVMDKDFIRNLYKWEEETKRLRKLGDKGPVVVVGKLKAGVGELSKYEEVRIRAEF